MNSDALGLIVCLSASPLAEGPNRGYAQTANDAPLLAR
jgi:hypothetical protein